jgi:hypothetical protein
MERVRDTKLDPQTLAVVAAGAAAGALVIMLWLDYKDERNKKTPIWDLHSDPKLPFDWDRYARILTNPIMKMLAGGIVSHHPDWIKKIPDREEYSKTWYTPLKDKFYDRFQKRQLSILDHARGHMRSGVQEVLVVKRNKKLLNGQLRPGEGVHLAFQTEGQTDFKKDRKVIPGDEAVRFLISTRRVRVIIVDANNNEVPSIIEGPIDRNHRSVRSLRQF